MPAPAEERPFQPDRLMGALDALSEFLGLVEENAALDGRLRLAGAQARRSISEARSDLVGLLDEVQSLREKLITVGRELHDVEEATGRLTTSLQEEEWPAGQ